MTLVFALLAFTSAYSVASAHAVLVSATPYLVGDGVGNYETIHYATGNSMQWPGVTFRWPVGYTFNSIVYNFCNTATATIGMNLRARAAKVNWAGNFTEQGQNWTNWEPLSSLLASSTWSGDIKLCSEGYTPVRFTWETPFSVPANTQVVVYFDFDAVGTYPGNELRMERSTGSGDTAQFVHKCYQYSCYTPWGYTGYGGWWPRGATTTQPAIRVNGSLETTEEVTNLLLDACPVLGIDFCTPFSKIISWAFVLPDNAFQDFQTLGDDLKNKPPFGYFGSAAAALGGLSTSSSAFSLATSAPIMSTIFTPLRSGLAWLIYFAALIFLYKRVTNIHI